MIASSNVRDIVLLGAGHAHVEVLRRVAEMPIPGVKVTLIARERMTPYSGMLPAFLRGEVTFAETHLDCAALARRAKADLVLDAGVAIDREERKVRCADGAVRRYDLLSVNIGGTPRMAADGGIPVKPIGRFLDRLAGMKIARGGRIAVIGTGAAGVELALALRRRVAVGLIGPSPALPHAPKRAQEIIAAALAEAGIEHVAALAEGYSDGIVRTDAGPVSADGALWATGVVAAPFLADSGLACDADGCVLVGTTLQSLNDPRVLAAGDCASSAAWPRPKAGVWAVRAGGMLESNLRGIAVGQKPRPWRPQGQALAIIGLGDGRALAWRNGMVVCGHWVAKWKRLIDRRWMARYQTAA